MPAEATIYLVRHAHAHWSTDDDRPLSSAGAETAQLVAARLGSRPIAAIYTSPSRRSIETIAPLADRLGLHPVAVDDLRERELPVVPVSEFHDLVRTVWEAPAEAPGGGESNVRAQARGLAAVRAVAARHAGSHAVVATHGNLLALVLNALDPRFGYEFWRQLSFPDIYQLTLHGLELRAVERLWPAA
jgi:2,3-bisphosphoglycerate-dependent phosphoglycerate mutase